VEFAAVQRERPLPLTIMERCDLAGTPGGGRALEPRRERDNVALALQVRKLQCADIFGIRESLDRRRTGLAD
jgi:hypothetical protein